MTLPAFLAGFVTGAATATFALAWWFFRLFATREETATAPRDPHVEGLLAHLAFVPSRSYDSE